MCPAIPLYLLVEQDDCTSVGIWRILHASNSGVIGGGNFELSFLVELPRSISRKGSKLMQCPWKQFQPLEMLKMTFYDKA